MLRYKKLTDYAYTPTWGSDDAAGVDLYSAHNYLIPAGSRELVLTDLQLALPEGTYGRIASRSGLALHNGIGVLGGVIDPDYRGNVGVILFNFSHCNFLVQKGDRVAQLVCEYFSRPLLCECNSLDETQRGASGFGSTGCN